MMAALKISTKIPVLSYGFLVKKGIRYFTLNAFAFLFISGSCMADPGFNPAFLENINGSDGVADLSAFSSGNGGQLPGRYLVDIYLNDERIDHRYVNFVTSPKVDGVKNSEDTLIPCFSKEELEAYGVNFKDKSEETAKDKESADSESPADPPEKSKDTCDLVLQTIPSAKSEFDFGQQRLTLSIPQAMLSYSARGYVDPKLWDEGISALMLDYDFSAANDKNRGEGSSSGSNDNTYYLNLRSGFNFGAWRARNTSALSKTGEQRKWQNINNYLQRSIVSLKSQFVIGDSYSTSDVFDGEQFRGVQLASDDEMLPDSLQGFAPVVRGIAKTNAQVSVSQNGYVIYQSYVSPGAFEITDLYPSGNSGDLTVVIKEDDGSQQTFIQPYASVPVLQREGRTKYSLTAGQYRNGYGGDNPIFGQFTLIHGFSKGLTLYSGYQASEKYNALALGVGKNLGDIGAISVDVTEAKTLLPDSASSTGQSFCFLYAKSFADSGTDFRLLGYRYSTKGFYTLQESVELNDDNNSDDDFDIRTHKRSKIEGSVNQSLPETFGSFYFSASIQDYWGDNAKEQTLQWGYSNNWQGISYNIAFSNSYITGQDSDKQISLNVSLPLDRWLRSSWATYNVTHNSRGQVNQQAGISGTLLDDNNLNYSVSQSYGTQGQGNSGSSNLSYQGRYGNSNIGYSYSPNSNRVNYGLKGGVVAHSEGITFSQPLGETVVLVSAPGAGGTKIINNSGVSTNDKGFAVLPYVTPYRRNTISLDATSLNANVEIEESAKDVIPTRGAVVKAGFVTHIGFRVMMTISRDNGHPLPFGAIILLSGTEGDVNSGIVGEAGEAYLSGLPQEGVLKAQWGKGDDQSCFIHYKVSPDKESETEIYMLKEKCTAH
ncbi:fimbria/pilus outer membrane usher protein [Rahnella selenatireducens]|uniref:fimbria/pilus outer membrane usher protein n=1 Tax=Rahnella selenatireducens TaxID=3389797 RepID=UPI00396914A6